MNKTTLRAALGAVLFASFGSAHAHCGSAFCLVNTSWDVQGLWNDPGSRLDLRYESIDQDSLKHGSGADDDDGDDGDALQPAARRITGAPTLADPGVQPHHDAHDHVPVRTTTHIVNLAYERSFSREWGLSLVVPWIDRTHQELQFGSSGTNPHIHTSDYAQLGDARVTARWQLASGEAASYGLRFGLKLPTGSHDQPGPHDTLLDRSLQPGTGTTDAILGVYANGRLGSGATGWFSQLSAQRAFAERDDYRNGTRVQLDTGVSHAFGARVLGLLQLNGSWSGRDAGSDAEPEDSGSRSVSLSPGVNVSLGQHANLYAFVEKPLWRRVNGEQLVADYSAAAGFNWAF
ncbi:MAG: hypothetical protein ABI411_12400 [Tahibacter sp.]